LILFFYFLAWQVDFFSLTDKLLFSQLKINFKKYAKKNLSAKEIKKKKKAWV